MPREYFKKVEKNALNKGYTLSAIEAYALTNASGHIRLYPDLKAVDDAVSEMTGIKKIESQE